MHTRNPRTGRCIIKPSNIPKIVRWSGYLTLTLVLGLILSVLCVRAGLWHQGLLLYALCCLGSTGLLSLFAVALTLRGFTSWRGQLLLRSLAVIPGTFLLLSLLISRGDYPAIHDITTDTVNPPVFTHAHSIRNEAANSLKISAETMQLQRAAYPDIRTNHSTLNFSEAFAQAISVAQKMGWETTFSDANAGLIEAVDSTTIMAFKDDIIIRLRHFEHGTLVDLRSASRVGQNDLGANAKRIQKFMHRFNQ